ncbi:AAA family ATPase [Methylobacillus sp.]|uniref:AAA family ATPase n=1 Tax=Methylobacillus sp. TaxID=56818 RepID=UPI0012C68C7D|nr:AAA family ATPase [Methylobacillus sp.]MPS48480.1 hypothetical protein [Methylobacillus sp.]
MDIIQLDIENFLAVGQRVSLGLTNQGLVLIEGVNNYDSSAKSNGAGKSSIADALCWTIYGETAREESGDTIVNNIVGKNTHCRVILRDGETTYEISRYRKHKEHKNQVLIHVWNDATGSTKTELSKGTEKESQALITEIVGCTLEVFAASIYAGQEHMPDIPRMTDKTLKVLVEQAAGIERLEKAYELANKDVTNCNTELKTLETQHQAHNNNMVAAQARRGSAAANYDSFEAARPGKIESYKQTARAEAELAKQTLAEINTYDVPMLTGRLEEIKKDLALSEQRQQTAVQRQREAQTHLLTVVNKAESDLSTLLANIKSHQVTIANAEVEISKPCKTCGKPHDPSEIDQFKATHQDAINELLNQQAGLEEAVRSAKKRQVELAKVANEAQAAYQSAIPSALIEETQIIQGKLAKFKSLEAELTNKKARIASLIEQAKAAQTEANPHASALQMIDQQLKEIDEGIASVFAQRQAKERELSVLMGIARVFSPAGVRAHILDTVTPFLNDRTAEYLSVLTDGNTSAVWTTVTLTAKGELREKFNIEVTNDKGAKTFKGLSGGEKRKVRLATMLALQDLVASRASKPIRLWIGDEIDDAMDAAGIERLMSLLELKARERGTVMVISHNEMRDYIDDVLTVTRGTDGISTIEGALVI